MRIPKDNETEQLVLGAILLDITAVHTVIPSLQASVFFDPRHRDIYTIIQKLYEAGTPIDIITVTRGLREINKLESIGVAYIPQLTGRVASTANIEVWIAYLKELYMRRQLLEISLKYHQLASDETVDVFDMIDKLNSEIDAISGVAIKSEVRHVSSATATTLEALQLRQNSDTAVSGIPSGIRDVDIKIGGHQQTDLMYMAGRPGMGKTAMALTEILNMAQYGYPVAFFSLEMSNDQVVYRLASMICQIPAEKLMKYKLLPHETTGFVEAVNILNRLPIYIDDTPGVSVSEIKAKIRRLRNKHKIAAVFIDYIQLMTSGNTARSQGMNREQELSTISRTLKIIAKENNIAIIALSQLSRAVESRQDKRPMLSDLRESGSLEQDADLVVFLFRPEYYGMTTDDAGNNISGIGEYIIAKNRNGSIGIVEMRFIPEQMKYVSTQSF